MLLSELAPTSPEVCRGVPRDPLSFGVENSREKIIQRILDVLAKDFPPEQEDLKDRFKEPFSEEYLRTFEEVLRFVFSCKPSTEEPSDDKIVLAFYLFLEKISSNFGYQDKNGNFVLRRGEVHRTTHQKRNKVEHPLGANKLTVVGAYQYKLFGENEQTKQNLEHAKKTLGESDFFLCQTLGALMHDCPEDALEKKEGEAISPEERNTEKKKVFDEIKDLLDEYCFTHLEPFLIPILRILTHRKDELTTQEYVDLIENPKPYMFRGYELSADPKKAITTLCIHIKAMGDIAQNWKSPQSDSALKNKVAIYIEFVYRHYPDFDKIIDIDDRLDPEIRHLLQIYREKDIEAVHKEIDEILTKRELTNLNN